MKIVNLKYLWIVSAILLCTGCYKEDGKLSPSNNPEDLLSIPQGTHDYDDIIVDWYEKYGFTALYIFENKDIYWSNETWLEGGTGQMDSEIITGNEIGTPGDQKYVGEWCDMFDRILLSHYPDDFIAKAMPFRVYICSKLLYAAVDRYSWTPEEGFKYTYEEILTYEGYDNIVVSGASAKIHSLTREEKLTLSQGVNSYLLGRIADKGLIKIPDEFFEVSIYENKNYYGVNLFANGYLNREDINAVKETFKKQDLISFFKLLGYPLEVLEGEPEDDVDSDLPSVQGLFNRPEGVKCKQKYDILVKAVKDAGIKIEDIQNPSIID